jgi:hypothetical protein
MIGLRGPLRSALGRAAREAALYPRALTPKTGKRVIFFPSGGREQSSLLRAYNIAAQMDGLGWSTLVVPKHLNLRQRRRIIRLFRPDVCVLQKCRHPLNRAEYFGDVPIALDLDDADFLSDDLAGPMADVARCALGVICGSRYIQSWAEQFNANAQIVWTGSEQLNGPWPDHHKRAALVSWAQSDPAAYPVEFDFVVDVLTRVRAQSGPFKLRLYGWKQHADRTRIDRLNAAGIETELLGMLPYHAFLQSLRDVAVGLSPLVTQSPFSRGKSFGKVLGYLDAKVPVVCSDAADHALFFTPETGIVTNDKSQWVEAITALLAAPARRHALSEAAHARFTQHLSVAVAAAKVDKFLSALVPVPAAPSV